ncbi:Regulator of V-ATPase in vacuolar membrane protein 1 [Colletotrichum higginsianum]|uniref:Regulator of V-ATPase in vacuolar membrane protein 1 n=1 Tax=Colletotrichum higginsianum TaxID=80884 RepID=A0A4T0VY09_9PEZI|nr:Regulator of V-ATPase in vacuolar membrane protein 1 [Colletotrichum higginsianum]
MRAVLPGRPRSGLQALATGFWDTRHFNVYITGSAFTILTDSDTVLQTIYDDDPSHLQAVAFDESSGKIATCTKSVVRVYRPFGQPEDALKWGLQSSFPIPDPQNAADGVSLSWGGTEELLVGHCALYLYSTIAEPAQLWNKPVPNPLKVAELSYDSAYIASVGLQDCLVKVWRRLTYGADDVRFDLAYLRHPDVITSLRWRKPFHAEQTVENALYTICADNVIATITSEQEGLVWEVNLPRFKLKDAEGIAYMLPVDPAGSAPVTSSFLDVFARDIAISYTHTGRVDFWTARVDKTGKHVGWLSTSSAETGLSEPALVSGSTLKKAALVDSGRSQLFIWDIGGARLEFTQDYGTHNTIQDLDWTSTPDSQSILAVGFQSKVVLLCQMRFDYLNKGPAWAAVREISILRNVLMSLHQTLKFLIAGETVDDYLGLDPAVFYTDKVSKASEAHLGSHFSLQTSKDEADETFGEETAYAINERLTKVGLRQLSGHEQIQLADIVECVGLVEKQRRSLDENGARFMLFFRQHGLRKGRTSEIQMSWREINWAYHSTSQDILTDFVIKQCHGTVRWEDARESGMFMWLSDLNALRTQFENVARNEYTKSDMKNPVDCSIYYLALKKKTVLQGLWRIAHWNREQGATQKLLANNFEEPKWRTTALKNAYALLSKRRFEYAAAFFLLADHLQDAVNVCLNQLKDLQLAVAIARVYEGDQGPVLRKLLEEEVLAVAAKEGNRWLASWVFWMLNRKDMAVRALISPVYTLVETPYAPDMRSKLFLTDDPALVVLYSQLRQKTLQTLRGASKVTPRVEWEFVLHSAKLYDRMGCDLLGLDLVRNWEFLKPASSMTNGLGGEVNPLKMLRRRSSLVVADLPMSSLHVAMRSGGSGKQSTTTVFQEPDSSSLLDSFGF